MPTPASERMGPNKRTSDGGSADGARPSPRWRESSTSNVVPRLVTARRTASSDQQWDWGTEGNTKAQQVAELTHALLTDGDSAAYDYVDAVRTRGSTLERIYLELITPTARHLGELWVEDMCGFTDVTVGLWRLQRIVREMSPLFQLDALRGWSQDQILLAPMPGEQHTFGTLFGGGILSPRRVECHKHACPEG